MGASCTCTRQPDRFQVITNEAVVAKHSIRLASINDPAVNSSTVSHQLSTYLEENQAYMNKKLIQLFLTAIEKPSEALSSLQLKLCPMKDGDWVHFSTLVTHGKAALQFMVWKTKLSQSGFEFVCSYLSIFSRLTTLTLEDIGLGRHKMSLFADGLKHLEGLNVLNLAVNDLTADHIELIIPAFTQLDSLTQINLDENKLGDQGCLLLQSSIGSLPKLNMLGVRYNLIFGQGVKSLLAIVAMQKGLKIFADGNDIEVNDLERLKSAAN